MSLIGNQYFDDGSKPTAAQLNTVYDSVVGDDVKDANAQVDWANREHFSTSNRIVELDTFDYDGQIDWTTSSTTYTTIENVASTPSQVAPSYTTHGKALVRVHASGLVSQPELGEDDGQGLNTKINWNTYAFRLKMTLNGGASTVTLANCTYSFTARAALTSGSEVRSMANIGITWRSFAFSGLYPLAAGDVIDKIELQACVGYDQNVLKVRHNHIQMIVVEN